MGMSGMRFRGRGAREELERRLVEAQGATARLQVEHDRLLAALGSARDAIVIVDPAGEVVMRNTAAERFHGARHGDAVAEVVITRLLDDARAGDTREEELSLLGPPSQVLSISAAPLEADGAVVGAVAFVQDVTDVRRVESVRRDFVANVSHELKTPIGALALLAETIAAGDDSTTHDLSERLVREADRLARIIDDLLDLSLIEAQEKPSRSAVPVRQLLNDAIDRVHAAADAQRIPIVVTGPDDVMLTCDPTQVVSALANLLENAVKYSDEGQPVEVAGRVEDERIVLEVRDRGIGIPANDLERIFERFYRVDRARSRATGGTGLGLSIVRHVAHAHDGVVTVDSVEGEGSTLRLILPAYPATNGA
jgi:two-component system sensor histidine kinase SenX3